MEDQGESRKSPAEKLKRNQDPIDGDSRNRTPDEYQPKVPDNLPESPLLQSTNSNGHAVYPLLLIVSK